MNVIEVHGVTKRFRKLPPPTTLKRALAQLVLGRGPRGPKPTHLGLSDINLTIEQGTTLGVIGHNGAGKSTLLRMLAGVITPDSGWVKVHGKIAFLSLGIGFVGDLTGRQNIMINGTLLGLTRQQLAERIDQIIEFSELEDFIDQPVRIYSSGMYMRLAFSIAINIDPDILLLDEVIAVGDAPFVQKCLDRLMAIQGAGKTIVLVTHALDTVRAWCTKAVWMHKGQVRAFGAPDEVVEAYKKFCDLGPKPQDLPEKP